MHAGLNAAEPLIPGLWTPSDWYLSLGPTPAARAAAFLDALSIQSAGRLVGGVSRSGSCGWAAAFRAAGSADGDVSFRGLGRNIMK